MLPASPRERLLDLVSRMVTQSKPDGTPFRSSDESPSWHAHREAETLTDPALADAAMSMVESERVKDRRSAFYFVIGKIGEKTEHARCASFLVARVSVETDKYVLYGLLNRIADVPKDASVDLAPVYARFHDRWALVSHSAISAVVNSTDPLAERHLLEVLATSKDANALVRANAALAQVGTAQSIPVLRGLAFHKKADVACSAINTLGKLGSDELGSFFVDCLAKGGPKSKWYAMMAIERHCDASAVDVVFARLKKILGGARKREQLPRSEALCAVTFLWRYRAQNAALARKLDELVEARHERLFETEECEIGRLREQT